MKLELKENMYVRTKDGIIDKILKLNKSYVKGVSQKDELYAYDIDNIVKASYNIIDLIEEGDYVNGYRVDYIANINKNNNFILQRIFCEEYEKDLYSKSFKPSDIKSVVTKEQFEQMSYKIGDDEK